MTGHAADDAAEAGAGAAPRRGGGLTRLAVALTALGGLAALGYGIDGLLSETRATNPHNSLRWLIAGVLAHDVLLVPAVALVGLLLSRAVPGPYRAVVQGALIVSGSVAAASLPLWRGYGGTPGNATVDALPYGRNLLIVLGAVWAAATVIMVFRRRRSRRSRRSRRTGPARGM
ncbi:conserved membrane hypothetical protein [Frankia sp. Hr75.2]|nr:conserved membrane hypothetical protein [Frankia sp. Hr75.2]